MSEVKKYQDTGERPAEKKVHTEEAKPDAGRLYGEGEEPGREELHDGIGRSEADMLYDEELLSRIENAAARGAQLGSRYGILLATMITLLLIVAAVFILPVFFGIDNTLRLPILRKRSLRRQSRKRKSRSSRRKSRMWSN